MLFRSRVFHLPFDVLITVAVNAALMSSLWFFLPPSLRDAMFTLHGSLAFAFVLSSWMYADVPATNVLGSDADRTLAAIDRPEVLRRLLFAKTATLWLLVAPPCVALALVQAAHRTDPLVGLLSAVGIAVVPLGALAVTPWLGVLLPYHPIHLRDRFRLPDRRTALVRWGVLVLTPYLLVPAVVGALLVPTLLEWGFVSPTSMPLHVPDGDLALGIATACALAVAAALVGRRVTLRLIARRRDALVAYLSDPARG